MSRPEAVRRHAASINSLRPTPAPARTPTLPDLRNRAARVRASQDLAASGIATRPRRFLDRLQILDKIRDLGLGQTDGEDTVIVHDYIPEGRESPIVEEASLLMRPEPLQG